MRASDHSPAICVVAFSALWLTSCTHVGPTISAPETPASGGDAFHRDFDSFLKRSVPIRGWVDYRAATRDRADLDRYVARLAAVSPDSHPELFTDDAQRLAYWINAYNASTIAMVLDAYPIESVKDVHSPALFFLPRTAGFFYLRQVTLGGKRTNLYDLENGLIRKRFAEPRIHFALNCASLSCPELPPYAFLPSRLDEQLAEETERFVSSPEHVRLSPDGALELSAIFDWYDVDFEQWMRDARPDEEPTLAGYVRTHLSEDADPRIRRCVECPTLFLEYDWGLNDVALSPDQP